jgi:hypothetical protein
MEDQTIVHLIRAINSLDVPLYASDLHFTGPCSGDSVASDRRSGIQGRKVNFVGECCSGRAAIRLRSEVNTLRRLIQTRNRQMEGELRKVSQSGSWDRMIRVADDEKLKRTAKWENSKEVTGAVHTITKMTPTLWIGETDYHHTT